MVGHKNVAERINTRTPTNETLISEEENNNFRAPFMSSQCVHCGRKVEIFGISSDKQFVAIPWTCPRCGTRNFKTSKFWSNVFLTGILILLILGFICICGPQIYYEIVMMVRK